MRPTIINAHQGESENLLLLFISFSHLQQFSKQKNSTEVVFANKLSKKGYEVTKYAPAKTFSGNIPDKDGGYAFTINEDSCESEDKLLKDVYKIIFEEQ